MTLDQLNLRQSARVVAIHSDSSVLHSHCAQLGIAPGAPIEVLHRAVGRGPMQAKVQGALYAIRQEDAAAIEVTV
ncbi:ferrous iron transport protein A [Simiduia sp. 21SJ11W-1]|uniref:FeoA family protein n=1 Tax=Simiduia sp. 21SJ11W-1 TaxID=2909669 RepID=UPI00209FEE04|nr:FeoA family protein [Simiduia sp. 21SJ11W-1]UTA47186.1 ferrous iron transport protein A [Simiduia sp. 21SJ11W-1]